MSDPDYKETVSTLGITASMAGYIVANKESRIDKITPQTIKESSISDE